MLCVIVKATVVPVRVTQATCVCVVSTLELSLVELVWYKQWKSRRWWEVEHSPREGPCELSQRPRAL